MTSHGGFKKSLTALIAVPLLAAGMVISTAVPAAAEPLTNVGILQTTEPTQESGEEFQYTVAFECSNVDDPPDPCEDVHIRIPIDPSVGLEVSIDEGDLPAGATWHLDEETGDLIVELGTVLAGESTTFDFSLTPPNHVTPNGTEWTLTPVAESPNSDPNDVPLEGDFEPSVTSVATAEVNHTISKQVNGSVFREPGESVSYTIRVACRQDAAGNLFAESMTVTDELPEGLIFESSDPEGTADGSTITWELPADAEFPNSCSEDGSTGATIFTVHARVAEDFVPEEGAQRLENLATTTATGIGETESTSHQASAGITVTDDPTNAPGNLTKDSFGQLTTDAETGSDGSRTTFPGPWNGYVEAQSGNIMANYRPNEETNFSQSGYKLEYRVAEQVLGYQVHLAEPMPCFAGSDGPQYSSNEPGELCAQGDLAFHATTVSIWARNPAHYELPPITQEYRPTVTLASDESVHDMELSQHGGSWANFSVPSEFIGDIAEINFPRDPGMASDLMRWGIFGYADEAAVEGDVLHNIGTATSYFREAEQPSGDPSSQSADLFIVDGVAIGIQKALRQSEVGPGGTVDMDLRAFLDGPRPVTEDLVVTDLLPAGFTWPNPTDTVPSNLELTDVVGGDAGETVVSTPDLPVEVIENFQGTGRQLIRITLPGDLFPESAVQSDLRVSLALQASEEPGVYTNTAQVFHDSVDLSTTCNQSPQRVQISDDPMDLDGNPNTQRHCENQDDVIIVPPSGSASFALTKTVQGDSDPAPRVPPAIGMVTEEGGTVTFGLGWRNTGAATLENVVLYDVFPHVGDTGVGGSQAGVSRGSQFDATFVTVGEIPEGVTVAYSQSQNPCRPEVYSAQTECEDDWSTTVPDPASSVTGIRMMAEGPYTSGQGFDLDLEMTTPPIETGQVAWNSVAGTATNINGTQLLPAEPPKVGLTAYDPEVPVILEKVSDVQEAAPGDTVNYTLRVSNPGAWVQEDIELTDTLPAGLTFVEASGDPTVDGQEITWAPFSLEPFQAIEFTVTTNVDAGAIGQLVNLAAIPGAITPEPCDEDEEGEACAPIEVPGGQLIVNKNVEGAGAQFAPESFDVEIDCTIEGNSALGFPRTETIEGNGSTEPIEAPLGSLCVVTEPETGGATSVTIDPEGGVEIIDDEATPEVTVTNIYEVGNLQVSKSADGVGAAAFSGAPVQVEVTCEFNGEAIFTESISLTVDNPTEAVLSDVLGPLPIGASCTVTETDAGGADETAEPVSVEISENEEANLAVVDLVNVYSAGTVEVTKEVTGPGADQADGMGFEIMVQCQVEVQGERSTVFSGTLSLTGDQTLAITNAEGEPVLLPVGATCFASEPESGGASAVVIEHDSFENGVVVQPGSPEEVQVLALSVVNEFEAPPTPEPSDPEPSDPEPSDPEPSDPAPTDSSPTDPEPTDPVSPSPDADKSGDLPGAGLSLGGALLVFGLIALLSGALIVLTFRQRAARD